MNRRLGRHEIWSLSPFVTVMALYPQTTCFYKGVVSVLPTTAMGEYEVLFEDPTYPEGYSPPLPVPQRYVIAIRDKKGHSWSSPFKYESPTDLPSTRLVRSFLRCIEPAMSFFRLPCSFPLLRMFIVPLLCTSVPHRRDNDTWFNLSLHLGASFDQFLWSPIKLVLVISSD